MSKFYPTSSIFPWIYLLLLSPIVIPGISTEAKIIIIFAYLALGLLIQPKVIIKMSSLILTSLVTFLPLSIIIQWAKCSNSFKAGGQVACISGGVLSILIPLALCMSAFLLAVANEWRGTLIDTANGLRLPQNVRIMTIVGMSLVGEFKKAMFRSYHAFAARGQASPKFHWRNFLVLPRILCCVWAAVLKVASDKLDMQWSSEDFWNKYVPTYDKYPQKLS